MRMPANSSGIRSTTTTCLSESAHGGWMLPNRISATAPISSIARIFITPTALGPSTKYFNAYALMNADAIYNGQRGVDPDKRVFLLTRSGFAGQQRYSTATWSGDIATRWEDMKAQISA